MKKILILAGLLLNASAFSQSLKEVPVQNRSIDQAVSEIAAAFPLGKTFRGSKALNVLGPCSVVVKYIPATSTSHQQISLELTYSYNGNSTEKYSLYATNGQVIHKRVSTDSTGRAVIYYAPAQTALVYENQIRFTKGSNTLEVYFEHGLQKPSCTFAKSDLNTDWGQL